MLKTYQFKTLCKGDIHSSQTANIILSLQDSWQNTGERPYVYKRSSIQTRWHELFQPASIDVFELENDFVHVRAVYSVAHPKKSPVEYI